MFLRTLIISMTLLVQQAVFANGFTFTFAGQTRTITESDYDNAPSSVKSAALQQYNQRNGTSLSQSQFREMLRNEASNVSQTDINNATNNANQAANNAGVDTTNPENNSNLINSNNVNQLQENGVITSQQANETNRLLEQQAANRANLANAAAQQRNNQEQINQTQGQIDNLSSTATNLNSQTSNIQTQIAGTSDRIAALERQANQANTDGNISDSQRIQDEIEQLRRQEDSQKRELAKVNAQKAKLALEMDAAQKRLREQQRQQQILNTNLESAQAANDDVQNQIGNVINDVTSQPITNIVDQNTLEENGLGNVVDGSGDAPTVDDVANIIDQQVQNGNITVDDEGQINIDTDAIVADQNESNAEGYCMEESGICVSNQRAVEYAVCFTKYADEKAACEQDVARGVTKDFLEGGEGCAAMETPASTACRDAGRIYNCEYDQCLTEDQANELADSGASCMQESEKEAKDACFNNVKNTAIANAAKGEYCMKESAEAKACEASGKSWNCNMSFCADEFQNDVIADAVVECQNKPSKREVDHCMKELKANGEYLLASACEEAQGPQGQACAEGGNIWNCGANACVTPDMNGRLVEAYKNCQKQSTPAAKDQCMGELNELAAAASEGGEMTEEDLKSPGNPASAGYAVVTAVGTLVSSLVAGGICFAAGANLMAGGMAMMNEKETAKMADQEMSRLRTEYKKIEAKTKSDVVSFEVQVEAINFYIQALGSAIRIAEQYAKGYDNAGNMFGIAAAVAAIEMLFWWSPETAKCGGIAMGSSIVGMGLSKKAAGIARGMANDFKQQKAKLERIKALFDKHFGRSGGLSQFAMNSSYNQGMNVGRRGAVTSAVGAKGLNANEKVENEAIGCIGQKGAEDNCDCKKTKTCLNLEMPKILTDTKIGRSLADSLDIENTLSESNSIARGDLSQTQQNGSSLASRFAKTRKVTKKLFDQLNKKYKSKLKKKNIKLDFPNDKMLAGYINRVAPPSSRIGGASKYMGKFLGDVDPKDIEQTQEAMSANFTEDGRAVATQSKPIQTKFGKFKMPEIPEYTGEELDILAKKKDQEIVNSEFNGDMAKLKDLPDVHENSTKSLWNILTKRYHVITRQKRIGKFRKAR